MPRRTRLARGCIAAVALAAVFCACACGDDGDDEQRLYVDGGSTYAQCDDKRKAEDAERDAPLCTLSRALALATPGAKIEVAPGRYPRLEITDMRPDGQVTITAGSGGRAIIGGVSVIGSSGYRLERLRIADTVEIEKSRNIEIAGSDISPNDISVGESGGLVFENNRIHDLEIQGATDTAECIPRRCGYGLRLNYVHDVRIEGNRFEDIPADGIQILDGNRIRIKRNIFRRIEATESDVHSDSIQVVGRSDGISVDSNRFTNARGPIFQEGPHRRALVVNNLFAGVPDWTLNADNAPGMRIVNNTSWHAGRVALLPKTTGVVLRNNILPKLQASKAQLARFDHNLDGRVHGPRYANPERGDFRLRSGSPGRDAGTTLGAPRVDIRGAKRGSRPDIGAFEAP